MLIFFYVHSQNRKYWILLICSAATLISISILIQYFFFLKPCILCIYQRCALFGIIIASILPIINPKYFLLRCLGILIWIYSAFKGLLLSKKHMITILYPSPYATCDLFIQFPEWLPLNKWFPIIFNSISGDCFSYKWYFLSLEISQWMLIIFLSYLSISLLTIISQFTVFHKK